MCCYLDQLNGRLNLQQADWYKDDEDRNILHIKGIYEYAPAPLEDRFSRCFQRFSRYFQRLELLEKIAEIVDEGFHLLRPVFQSYSNAIVYRTLHDLHHGAHNIEHVLHSFCFLGDVNRFLSESYKFFFHQNQGEKWDYAYSLCNLETASRMSHSVAHFFNTAKFLEGLELCSLAGPLKNAVKYAPLLTVTGYAFATYVLWRRYQKQLNETEEDSPLKRNVSRYEVGIHFGGFLFEACQLTAALESFSAYESILSKVGSIAGIIHASSVVQYLMPKEEEVIDQKYVVSDQGIVGGENVEDDCHCASHHHHS